MQQSMKIGSRVFDLKDHTYVMGILNVTPDSFSDGGRYLSVDAVLNRVETMLNEGADIIDVGGESTRPGHTVIDDGEEIARVVPVIEAITKRFDVPVSIDTYKASVAKAALAGGAHMVNDIWGLQHDPSMAHVIAEAGAVCCLMHNQNGKEYQNFLHDCIKTLQNSVDTALSAGIARQNIILDPGIGFAKTYEQNLCVMQNLESFNQLDCPMLLGTSRKSMIGLALDLPVDERLEGTLVTTVLAVQAGWNFVRVHDIKENVRAIRMMEVIRHG
jgi:dihydropteroate synthase